MTALLHTSVLFLRAHYIHPPQRAQEGGADPNTVMASCRHVRWSAHSGGGPTPHEGGGSRLRKATSGPSSVVVVMVMLVEAEAAVTPLMLSDPPVGRRERPRPCPAGLVALPWWQEAPGSAPGCPG